MLPNTGKRRRGEENREVEDGFLIWKNLCGKLIGGKWDFLGGKEEGIRGKGSLVIPLRR